MIIYSFLRRLGRRLPHWPLFAAATIGVSSSLFVFALTASSERKQIAIESALRARDSVSLINYDLQAAVSAIGRVRTALELHRGPFGTVEFKKLVGDQGGRAIGLRDIGWAPRVTAADRDAFEATIRAAGHPGFQIQELDPNMRLVRAGKRAEYFPVLYVDSDANVERVVGLDLAVKPERRKVIEKAIETGSLAATPPTTFLTMSRPKGGIMTYVPVYLRDLKRTDLPGKVDGLVFGAFELRKTIANVIASRRSLDALRIRVVDPAASPGDEPIYASPEVADHDISFGVYEAGAAPDWVGHVSIGDQSLDVELAPPAEIGAILRTWHVWVPLIAGLLLTVATLLYLTASIGRTARLEALAAELRVARDELNHQNLLLAQLARQDPLTGLTNRFGFTEELKRALSRAERAGKMLAVLLVDLDRFKPVNDVHGHAVGDQVLCEVADRLRRLMRRSEIVARLGGDEFAIIAEGAESAMGPTKLAQRIGLALSHPILLAGTTINIGSSVGIALFPESGRDSAELLKAADVAMYRAKGQGQGGYALYAAS